MLRPIFVLFNSFLLIMEKKKVKIFFHANQQQPNPFISIFQKHF